MTTLNVYAVQGTSFTTVNLLHALTRAKSTASRKQPITIMLNGNAFKTVDYKGRIK